jgi:hypothetical protein
MKPHSILVHVPENPYRDRKLQGKMTVWPSSRYQRAAFDLSGPDSDSDGDEGNGKGKGKWRGKGKGGKGGKNQYWDSGSNSDGGDEFWLREDRLDRRARARPTAAAAAAPPGTHTADPLGLLRTGDAVELLAHLPAGGLRDHNSAQPAAARWLPAVVAERVALGPEGEHVLQVELVSPPDRPHYCFIVLRPYRFTVQLLNTRHILKHIRLHSS